MAITYGILSLRGGTFLKLHITIDTEGSGQLGRHLLHTRSVSVFIQFSVPYYFLFLYLAIGIVPLDKKVEIGECCVVSLQGTFHIGSCRRIMGLQGTGITATAGEQGCHGTQGHED